MTPAQAKVFLDSIPADEEVVILRPQLAKKQRIERDGVLSFRMPSSQKAAVLELFERIAAKIGSQNRADAWDYLLSQTQFWLDAEGGQP